MIDANQSMARRTFLPEISIVVPCYNEAAALPLVHRRLSETTKRLHLKYEVILVDDGSVDATWSIAKELNALDPRWKGIRLTRNFGHQMALSAGLSHAAGDAVFVMDADLQDPPELLAEFIGRWQAGFDVVYGIRRNRKENIIKRACYKTFYRLLSLLADTSIPEDSGDFCLMDRRVVGVLNAMPESNRFIRGLRAWIGYSQTGIEYDRCARAAGEPQYTWRQLLRLATDGLFSFSTIPLRFVTRLGLIVSTVAFLGMIFTLLQRVFLDLFTRIGLRPVPGFATIVISILFLGGIQLVCLGIVGEYVGRIYDEVKGRPNWLSSEEIGDFSAVHPITSASVSARMGGRGK